MTFAGLSFGQAPNIPICNGFDANGVPINTATRRVTLHRLLRRRQLGEQSLPAGTITGYTLIAGGSNYTAPTVVVTDMTGAPLADAAAPTPVVTGGVITGFTGGTGGAGYTAPVITIMDPTGSGALATAIIGPPYTGGMKKFLDPLVDLKSVIATPDTVTFANSDYYEIALVQYAQKMHSSLPPTTLRGYVQVPTGSAGCAAALAAKPKYLGPVILAQKSRPVRVKFTNCVSDRHRRRSLYPGRPDVHGRRYGTGRGDVHPGPRDACISTEAPLPGSAMVRRTNGR